MIMLMQNQFSCFLIGEGTLPIQCAELLLQLGHRILGVISPDESISNWAQKKGISHISPTDNLLASLSQQSFDYLFSIVNGVVLSKQILERPRQSAINYYDSLLPRYAGVNATSWALMRQEKIYRLTWHRMNEIVNGGDIMKQVSLDIAECDTALTLHRKFYKAAAHSFAQLIDELSSGKALAVKQNLNERTYFLPAKKTCAGELLKFSCFDYALNALVLALDFRDYPNPLGLIKLAIEVDLIVVSRLEVLDEFSQVSSGTITGIEPDFLKVSTGSYEVTLRQLKILEGEALLIPDCVENFALQIGDRFQDIKPEQALRIEKFNTLIAKHEAFWVERLASLQPIRIPNAERTLAHLKQKWLAYLQKLVVGQEMLGLDKVGVQDNFFKLGDRSLLATQIISQVCVASLIDVLRIRASYHPNQLAFTFLQDGEVETDSLTYQVLDQKARAIAAQLQQQVMKGERALLLYPAGLEFIAAFLGCLYAEVIAVPVELPKANRSINRLQAIGEDCRPKLALTTASLITELSNRLARESVLDGLLWVATDNIDDESANWWELPNIGQETLAFLQYTSGSTGTPKGVMVNHGNLLHNSEYIRQAFELTPESISVSWLPHFHDMGLIDGIIQPLYSGFRGILMPPRFFFQKPIRWLQAISHYRATHSGGPNSAYELCVRQVTPEQKQILDLSSWYSAYNGAEPVRQETLEQFSAAFTSCGFQSHFFYPCYGLAESTLMVAGGGVKNEPVFCQVEAEALEQNQVVESASKDFLKTRQLVGCGKGWLKTKVVIAEPELLIQCSPGQVGEIWVSSSSVAQGYWKQTEETKQTFGAYLVDKGNEPFLRTGDLGFLKDGELFVTGRLKDIIIIRGRNYYPQDIELAVEKSHPSLSPNCGAAFALEIGGREQLAVIQEVKRSYRRHLNLDEVIGNIYQALMEQYELSAYAVVLVNPGKVPKTSSGKLRRKACKEAFLNRTLDALGGKIGHLRL